MTDSEKLDLILSEMQDMKTEVQGVKTEMQDMKTEVQGVKTEMQDMKTEMQDMKTEMQDMKTEMQGVKTDVQDMKTEMQDMKTEMQGMKTEVQEQKLRTTNIELYLENATDKNVQLIAEDVTELTRKLNEAIPVVDKNLVYEVKVNYLAGEVEKLKAELAELKNRTA